RRGQRQHGRAALPRNPRAAHLRRRQRGSEGRYRARGTRRRASKGKVMKRVLLPAGWPRPKGYSNAISVRGRTIYVAGLIGRTAEEVFEAKDLPGQFEQLLRNLVALLAEDDAGPEHVVRMTWYITDKQAYLRNARRIGEIYR